MQVDFYHLTLTPLARALPRIAEKILATGQRLIVVSGSDEQRSVIDRLLWTYTPESFLPHACMGAGDDAGQPILIAPEPIDANGARMIALIDGDVARGGAGLRPGIPFLRRRRDRGGTFGVEGAGRPRECRPAILEADRKRLGTGRLSLLASHHAPD